MYLENLYRVIPNDTRVQIYNIDYNETTKLIFDGYIQKVDSKLFNKAIISIEPSQHKSIMIFLE